MKVEVLVTIPDVGEFLRALTFVNQGHRVVVEGVLRTMMYPGSSIVRLAVEELHDR